MIYIKMDLALNNLQRLICHKTQQTKPKQSSSSCGRLYYSILCALKAAQMNV